MDFEGLSVFDLSKGTGPKSFSRQLQEVLHAYDEEKQSSFALDGLDLLGACQLEATVTFAQDTVLQSLVGTLTVISFSSPAKLTERNLAMLQSGASPHGRRFLAPNTRFGFAKDIKESGQKPFPEQGILISAHVCSYYIYIYIILYICIYIYTYIIIIII
ncbi:unnamed protein product [Symbiodinium necroappetens]|uniref:Uncharacterized protein n=1 Tax=Symbiodinium necroappetens TaxID=1628268 RepID=A0A812X8D5_9DINO|nr:unnamed protein product [Symbiodinium necroappetens]